MPADTANAIIISDLSRARPADALSPDNRPGHWRTVDYETEDGLKGVMIFADPEAGAPELEIPLEVDGPHKIHLGINYTKTCYGDLTHYTEWSVYGSIDVKLTSDPGFHRVAAEQSVFDEGKLGAKMGKGKLINRSIQETYWKSADLTGQFLHVRLPIEPYNGPELREVANLSMIRLEPLSPAERETWERLQPRPETRRIVQIFCTGVLTGHIRGTRNFHPTAQDWFRHEFAPAAGTDVRRIVFEAVRGNLCAFKTKIGDVGPEDNKWDDQWIDPLASAVEAAHEYGIELHASLRMIGANYPMQKYPISRARHFFAHQDWVKRDKEGNPTTSLSLAYPEVRDYWLSLLSETLDYDIDGVVVYFHRFHPFALYEEPSVRDFRARYGDDPRDLPEDDPRWIEHTAGYVTELMRSVRALAREKGGRRVGATFFGCPTRYDKAFKDEETLGTTAYKKIPGGFDPARYNCDVFTWITEGLVDDLYPMSHADLDLICRIREAAGDRVCIYPDLMPRCQWGEDYVKKARNYYAAGVDGFCLNDGERRIPRISEWATQSRLGHKDDLDLLESEARTHYRRIPLKTLMGYATRYSFNNFG